MELAPGYNLTAGWTTRLTLLDWIHDACGGRADPVDLGPLFGDKDAGEQRNVAAGLEELERRGWLALHKTMDWDSWSGSLLPTGADFAEQVQQHRGDTVGRRRAARDAILQWLYNAKAAGTASPVLTTTSLGSYGLYYGHPFTEQEVADAAVWLREQGYLRGSASSGGGIPRPTIAAVGEQVVEDGRSVNDRAPATADVPAVAINVTGSQGVNIAANSPGATQSVTLTKDQRQQILTVADALQAMAPSLGLTPEHAAQAERDVVELREAAADPTADPGRVRGVLEQVRDTAVSAAASGMGNALVALVDQTVRALGGG